MITIKMPYTMLAYVRIEERLVAQT